MILIIHSQNTITHSLTVEADILFCFSDYESDYSHIYGRLPLPYGRFRQYPSPSHPSSRQMYVSEWE